MFPMVSAAALFFLPHAAPVAILVRIVDSDTFTARVFSLVSLAVIALGLFMVLKPFLAPLLWAGLLAMLVFPANVTLRRGLRDRRGLAALILTLAIILIVVIPVAMLIGAFFVQAAELTRWLQNAASEHHIAQPSDVLNIPAVDRVVRWISERMPITSVEIRTAALRGGEQVLQTLLSLAGSAFAGALGAVTSVVLSIFLFFFFLRDGEEIVRRGIRMIPMEDHRKAHLVAHLAAVTRGVVLGSLSTAIVQGTLVGIAFAIVGLPSPIVFTVIAMFAALVPVVGTSIVWVPAAIVLAIQGAWGSLVFMVVWSVAIVMSADNVIRPLFVSSQAKISTLPVFIGLFGGISAFGPIGMFLGPVLVALVLALFEFAEESKAEAVVAESADPAGGGGYHDPE